MRAPLRGLAVSWMLAFCLGTPAVAAQPPTASDALVKAAYIHKFPSFVEWPAEAFAAPGSPIVIAVVGEDEVYSELSKLVPGRTVLGRPVEVLGLPPNAQVPPRVHVLYIGARARSSGSAAPESARRGLLTVSDGDSGAWAGAALCFVEEDGRIRFDASPAAAERAGLKLSARLLNVARRRVSECAP